MGIGVGVPTATVGDPSLGLALRPLTPVDRAHHLKVEGRLVVENATGTAAHAAIRTGAVILGVNNTSVDSVDDMHQAVENAGDVVALLVQRVESRIYVIVRIG